MRADGKAPTLRRELLRQQAIADGMLGRSADTRHDQATAESDDARRQGHEGLEAAHHDATPPRSRALVKWRVSEA